jgi:hypothetical protein
MVGKTECRENSVLIPTTPTGQIAGDQWSNLLAAVGK